MFALPRLLHFPRIVAVAALALISVPALGQGGTTISSSSGASGRPAPKPIVKKPKPLSTAIAGGLRLNSNGWGLYGEYGRMMSDEGRDAEKFFDTRLFTIGFDEIKHPKEMRSSTQSSGGGDNPKPYIFGKVNNFYSLKLSYGFRKMIAGKPEGGTVSVHWMYQGGLALGLEKPYYLDAFAPQDNSGPIVRQTVKYSDANSAYFLNNNYIIGSAGFAQGLGETKLVPGLQARTGLHFDFSQRRKMVLAIDCGIAAEYYTRPIQILASQTDRPYFVSLYAGVQIGGRR